MRIGQKIKSLRESQRITQRSLAEKSGLKQGAFSQIENGLVTPREKTVARILSALGLSNSAAQDILIEAKLQELNMLDPGFVMMLKDVRYMTREEKQSIMDAYEFVKLKRIRKRHD